MKGLAFSKLRTSQLGLMFAISLGMACSQMCQSQQTVIEAKKQANTLDWCNSVKEIAPFTQPADGTICGQPFKVLKAKFTSSADNFEYDDLIISSDSNSQKIEFKFDNGYTMDELQGKTLTFTPQTPANMPVVKVNCAGNGNGGLFNSLTGLGLKLMFGKYDRSALPCRIILRLPAEQRMQMQGAFNIDM